MIMRMRFELFVGLTITKSFFMEQHIDRIYGLLATLQEGVRVLRPMVEAEHQ